MHKTKRKPEELTLIKLMVHAHVTMQLFICLLTWLLLGLANQTPWRSDGLASNWDDMSWGESKAQVPGHQRAGTPFAMADDIHGHDRGPQGRGGLHCFRDLLVFL